MITFQKTCPHCDMKLFFVAGNVEEVNPYLNKKGFSQGSDDTYGHNDGSVIFVNTKKCDSLSLFTSTVAHEAVHFGIAMLKYRYGEFNFNDKPCQEHLCQIVDWVVDTVMDKCEFEYED